MKSNNYNKTRFPRDILLCVSIVVFCGILCSYPHWGPSIANFFLVTLPSAKRSLLTPECLFLLLNAIVAFLVGESRLGRLNPSVPHSKDIYEEYVERSRRLRRVSSFSNYGNPTDIEIVKPDDPVEDKVGAGDKKMGEESGTWEAEKLKDEDDHEDDKGDHENNGGNNDEDDDVGLGADELNKRAEEFIAKVNQQRWIEARSVICT